MGFSHTDLIIVTIIKLIIIFIIIISIISSSSNNNNNNPDQSQWSYRIQPQSMPGEYYIYLLYRVIKGLNKEKITQMQSFEWF